MGNDIIWITWNGRRIPIKKGMMGKFDKKALDNKETSPKEDKQDDLNYQGKNNVSGKPTPTGKTAETIIDIENKNDEIKETKLYHATNYNIDKWDDKHFGENSKGGLTGGNGIYFTNENKNMNIYGKNTYETTFNGKLANKNEANNLFENHKKETGKWPDDKQKRDIMLKNNIDGANFNGDIVVYNVDKLNDPTIILKTKSDYEQYFLNQGYSKAVALKKATEIINQRKGK